MAALAAGGMSNKEIALHLGIRPNTVARLLQETFSRLELHSRNELAAEVALGRPPTPLNPRS